MIGRHKAYMDAKFNAAKYIRFEQIPRSTTLVIATHIQYV